jgi:ABC-2 type transport system permease protein
MPSWVKKLTMINPVKYFMFAIREICLKGTGIQNLAKEIYGLAAIGAVVFGGAVMLFHRKSK